VDLSGQAGRSSPVDPARAVVDWYRPRRRLYPWRSARPDAYKILVSEVMLQQTQVARVASAFPEFLRRFPTVRSLARAPRGEVIRAWSGLGYNRRAVALSRAARLILRAHGGKIPADLGALQRLPGVGPYTASAVASIAFGVPVPAVDTNLGRVVARARMGAEAHEVRPSAVEKAAQAWLDRADPGGWNQALMDLGREVCRPLPRCAACPLSAACTYRATGRSGGKANQRRPPFQGSMRKARGAIVRTLRDRAFASVGDLAKETGEARERVAEAIRSLAADRVVDASPAALAGRAGGRVRLPID
jgi:A/G-specific adenine glycosylase